MIELQKRDGEYIVINTETKRIIGRSKLMSVALEQYRQRISYAERRDAMLRRNEATRAASLGA